MIHVDWYTHTRGLWPEAERLEIERRIPEGYRMTVTHGGRRFRANLFGSDGELIASEEGLRPERAAERVLRTAASA